MNKCPECGEPDSLTYVDSFGHNLKVYECSFCTIQVIYSEETTTFCPYCGHYSDQLHITSFTVASKGFDKIACGYCDGEYLIETKRKEVISDNPATLEMDLPSEGGKDVVDLVIGDIEKRRELGIERYGTSLETNNGRDALVDLYQELLDGAMYCRQKIEEDRTRDGK